jgi:hypothetical protein
MIAQPSVFARTALVAALTASLILGVLAIMRPVDHVTHHVATQGLYSASH